VTTSQAEPVLTEISPSSYRLSSWLSSKHPAEFAVSSWAIEHNAWKPVGMMGFQTICERTRCLDLSSSVTVESISETHIVFSVSWPNGSTPIRRHRWKASLDSVFPAPQVNSRLATEQIRNRMRRAAEDLLDLVSQVDQEVSAGVSLPDDPSSSAQEEQLRVALEGIQALNRDVRSTFAWLLGGSRNVEKTTLGKEVGDASSWSVQKRGNHHLVTRGDGSQNPRR